MLEVEIWEKWIFDGEETRYRISNLGRIHDTKKDKYTYGYENSSGYLQWTFYLNNGKTVSKLVHRLVAQIFVNNPNPDEYNEVDHINANKHDNRDSNLRWCNNILNTQYAKKMGLFKNPSGEDSSVHKYTKKQIKKVIEMLKTGKYTKKEISKETGVHKHTITDIAYKKIWKQEVSMDDILSFVRMDRKFSDDQILNVIEMLESGNYTVKKISDTTGVTKSVIRDIAKHKIYKNLTEGLELKFKSLSKRASKEQILKAIKMLEMKKYTRKEISEKTDLSKSVVEKLAYHERWTDLTNGKDLGFKNSKN